MPNFRDINDLLYLPHFMIFGIGVGSSRAGKMEKNMWSTLLDILMF